MKLSMIAIAAASLTLGAQAMAADGQALAQKNACMSCHKVDAKLVGPAFKDIAAKYKGDKTAEAKLLAKVKAGGSGVWGTIPMPPNPNLKDDEGKAIIQWILSAK